MRTTIHKQISIVEPAVQHEHAKILQLIAQLIAEAPQVTELIYQDLIRNLSDPQAGRKGLMSAEQVFMLIMLKQITGLTYDELAFHLADSKTYRHFCGFGIADETPSESTIQRDIKKIRPETLEAIHRLFITVAKDKGIEKGDKARVDTTVVESNIHHPTDSSLLGDCVKVLSRVTQEAKETFGLKVPDHRRRAKKRALGILNAKKEEVRVKYYRDLLKVTRKTVDDAQRVKDVLLNVRADQVVTAAALCVELDHYIPLAKQVIEQTERRVLKGQSLKPQEKLVSIFEEHTDIIRKDNRDTYYGHKITITGGVSGLFTDLVIEKGNPADSTLAVKMICRQIDIFGRPPRQASFDGGFASKANLVDIKALGVNDVAFSKKCGLKVEEMAKSERVYKRLRNFRAGIEGMISFVKRGLGLDRCTWRGFESFKAYAWSSVIAANLLLMARHLLG